MNLYFRFLWVFITGLFHRSTITGKQPSRLTFRTWFFDLDPNFHMTNARYLSFMDLGRVDYMIRTELGPAVVKYKWAPMVGSTFIRYRIGLKPLQKFELITSVLGWDEKWFFMEQRFESHGKVYAVGLIRGLFKDKRRNVSPRELIELLGMKESDNEIGEFGEHFQSLEEISRHRMAVLSKEGEIEPSENVKQ